MQYPFGLLSLVNQEKKMTSKRRTIITASSLVFLSYAIIARGCGVLGWRRRSWTSKLAPGRYLAMANAPAFGWRHNHRQTRAAK